MLSVSNIDFFFKITHQLPPATGHCDNCRDYTNYMKVGFI